MIKKILSITARCFLIYFLIFGNLVLSNNLEQYPITGYCPDEYKFFDQVIINYMQDRGLKGATLAVIYNNKLILNRGYGWCDKDLSKYIQSNTAMRIASLSKIFTLIAINQLISQDKISLDTKSFEYLKDFKKIKDKRLLDITIEHLINHSAGWDQDVSFDPLFSLDSIAQNLNKDIKNITQDDLIKFVVENQDLDFDPGTKTSYSNFGYLILGKIIEQASGKSFINYINENICMPLGFTVKLARADFNNSYPTEVSWYFSNDISPESLFFNLNISGSTFGLISSAPDLCKLLSKYWITGEKRNDGEAKQALKDGSLPGTTALARQRFSGATIVTLINGRDNNNWIKDNRDLQSIVDNVANKCGL